MAKVVESIGSTYDEALKSGLEQIGLSEEEVTVEIVKDATAAKKTFFSILEPRQVKLLITEKTNNKSSKSSKNENVEVYKEKEIVELSEELQNIARERIEKFLDEYISVMGIDVKKEISYKEGAMNVTLSGENSGLIIGHRGETLEALQVVLSAVVNKDIDQRIRIIIDSENYREKRINSLKGLALREAEGVVRKRRNYTFEPMTAFERKAIHTALQNHPKVTTHSVGEEPYRKVVISLK